MRAIKRIPLFVITAVTRLGNLDRIGKDLQVLTKFFEVSWCRVFSEGAISPRFSSESIDAVWVLNRSAEDSIGGYKKKNNGLRLAEQQQPTWIYVLDDDNTVGMDFSVDLLESILQWPAHRAFVFGQQDAYGKVLVDHTRARDYKHIDQGGFVVHTDICDGLRYDVNRKEGDNLYINALHKDAYPYFVFPPHNSTYYNSLSTL